MTDTGQSDRSISSMLRSLPVRVTILLTIAMLPLGILAFWQTTSLTELAESRRNLSLIALTDLAVADETRRIERALGAAAVLSTWVAERDAGRQSCQSRLKQFVRSDSMFQSARFITQDGRVLCASDADIGAIRPETPERLAQMAERDSPALFAEADNGPTKAINAVMYLPTTATDGSTRYIVLRFSMSIGQVLEPPSDRPAPDTLLVMNSDSDVLKAIVNHGDEDAALPAAAPTAPAPASAPTTFVATAPDGGERVYVVFPMVPNVSFAVASWSPRPGVYESKQFALPAAILPVLMWVATILVAYFAMHRLVLRHIQRLKKEMRAFAASRRVPTDEISTASPSEIQHLEATFANMALDLADDEAQLENSLREKNILLKEVHHRVKNNLQMISSIMNMQIRATQNQTHKAGLKRLQDRILGLATVHRYLYDSEDLGKSNAAVILRGLFQHLFNTLVEPGSAIRMELDLDEVTLLPDQAVPLTLLAGELGTNAIKHMTLGGRDDHVVRLSLKSLPEHRVSLVCYNTTAGSPGEETSDRVSFGIGQQLIKAFATQLGATPEVVDGDGFYEVTVVFTALQALPEQKDY